MRKQQTALIAGVVASFLVPFMMSAVGIVLPAIQQELPTSAEKLSWVAGSYILSLAAILLPVGRLADIMGRRRIFVWGSAMFMIFSLCASLAWSIESLVAVRVLQGVGAAMILSTAVAIVVASVRPEERGWAMGWLVASVYIGLAIGPLLGGFVTNMIGWRAVFFLCIPPGLTAWLLAVRISDEWQPARGEAMDLWGSLWYGIFVLTCVGGLTRLNRPATGLPLLGLALASGVAFAWRSRHTTSPLIDLSLFTKNRIFLVSNIATMINYSGTFAVGFLLSLYLQVAKGFSPMHAGLILIIQPVVQSALSPVAGVLADKCNPAWLANTGMAVCAVGLWGFGFVGQHTPLWVVGGLLAFMGLGFALFASPNMTVIMDSVAPKDYSIASSIVATMRTFGMSLCMGLIAAVFAMVMADQPIAPETVPEFLRGMRRIFEVCVVLCGTAVVISLGRVGKRRQLEEEA
ncbi:MFS transporter [Desulfovibrionales bacterium]